MPGARQGNRRKDRDTFDSKPQQRTRQPAKQPQKERQPERQQPSKPSLPKDETDSGPIDLSITIPLPLQQLLLDVFKTALLPTLADPSNPDTGIETEANAESGLAPTPALLDTKSLIQTIKAHLYQRDFDSAFAEAGEELLRAYALRWSAARALGYAGIFKAVMGWMGEEELGGKVSTRAVCLGGGAGAEIVALAAAWRDLEGISLGEKEDCAKSVATESSPRLSIAAVDIADWSIVVDRLSKTITSPNVPTQKTSKYQPPLLNSHDGTDLFVTFSRKDVLGLAESDLKDLILGTTTTTASPSPSPPPSLLITLMFTLNELFTAHMAKATGLLLQMTEILPTGAVLLVVDSPGSYSTLKLGKGKDGAAQERQYPMKFLLDHTLLSVAKGKWERVLTQDSRWWRRDVARLRYEVGEGAGLEDMRYQVHVYRRL